MNVLASETARHTREFDLDKEEKLAKVDKWAKAALEGAPTAPKPRADIPDAQWDGARKDMQAQAYEALGMAASLRKKYDESAADYKQAIAVGATQDPATQLRLGQALLDANKLDEAAACYQQSLQLNPNSAQVHLNLALLFAAQGKLDEAAASYQQALRFNPDDRQHQRAGG